MTSDDVIILPYWTHLDQDWNLGRVQPELQNPYNPNPIFSRRIGFGLWIWMSSSTQVKWGLQVTVLFSSSYKLHQDLEKKTYDFSEN